MAAVVATNPNPLLSRFSDFCPVLVAGSRAVLFETSLMQAHAMLLAHPEGRRALAGINMDSGDDDFWPAPDDWLADYRPYNVKDGILAIPVAGVLLNNFPYQVGGFATGYDYLRRAFDRGLADSSVSGIAFVIDSPGGEVSGNFDLVDHFYSSRGQKPVRSFAKGDACSAAYNIASAGDTIDMTRDSEVGSIGVYTSHVDMSKLLEQMGLTVTLIDAPKGGHKVDGNPYEPLAADVKARIQGRIDEIYGVFVASVARNRGMDEKPIRDTQALCLNPAEALSAGLADSVGKFDDSMAAFAASLKGDSLMADIKESDHARIVAEATAQATSAATTAATAAAQARIGGILGCDEAKGRETLAQHFAFKTPMSVDDAKAALSAAPKQAADPKPKPDDGEDDDDNARGGKGKDRQSQRQRDDAFSQFMNTDKHPNLAQNGEGDDDDDDAGKGGKGGRTDKSPEGVANRILQNYEMHGGYVHKPADRRRGN